MSIQEKNVGEAPGADFDTSSTEKNLACKDVGMGSSEVEAAGFDAARTKSLLRKCDKVLLPFLALLYLLSFLDRTNIGNAKLANIEASLGMSGLDYNVSRCRTHRSPDATVQRVRCSPV
jgi:hypothetical protein